MKYIRRFEDEVGIFFLLICIGLNTVAFITGWFLLIINRRYPRVVTFISSTYFFGAVCFAMGSLLHFNFIAKDDILAIPMFWAVFGVTLISGVGGGILIVWVPLLQYLSGFMIGLAGGFSILGLFAIVVYSDIVLLTCSILMGGILGWMAYVFGEPLQIVVIPCTGVLLVQMGTLNLLECVLLLLALPVNEIALVEFYVSRCCFVIMPILMVGNIYYHYREYYLQREKFELMSYSSEAITKPLTKPSTSTTKLNLSKECKQSHPLSIL